MKAMTRSGTAGALPAKKKKTARGFMRSCGGSKSVSILSRAAVAATNANISSAASTTTPMKTAAAPKTAVIMPGNRDVGQKEDHEADASAECTPSVDVLLQQLRDLEQGVRALGVRERDDAATHGNAAAKTRPCRHRRSATGDWGSGRLDMESVAVVTESADPLRDFRQSMVQMIVENGITGGAALRELLQRFLSLNSPFHHHLILRAFADVWEELFAGGRVAPPPLAAGTSGGVHTVALTR